MHLQFYRLAVVCLLVLFVSCERDIGVYEPITPQNAIPAPFSPTYVELITPQGFPTAEIPEDNPLTEEGILLGKKLFNDPILSGNNTQSCANCHLQTFSFSDPSNVSFGIDGIPGKRNAMSLINLAWTTSNLWDGRAKNLEEQALGPVTDPIEMHSISWSQVIQELKDVPIYNEMFLDAFGIFDFDSTHVSKAIAQFERTLVSANSKFDKYLRFETNLTDSELRGMDIYMTEKGDCFHCHAYPFLTDNEFRNNGLDFEPFNDNGRGDISGELLDNGKFKTPTLRNVALTAPYMHDGRFQTLEEVVEHYNSGGIESSTLDPLMKHVGTGLGLTQQDKNDLINFMHTFTDTAFVNTNF